MEVVQCTITGAAGLGEKKRDKHCHPASVWRSHLCCAIKPYTVMGGGGGPALSSRSYDYSRRGKDKKKKGEDNRWDEEKKKTKQYETILFFPVVVARTNNPRRIFSSSDTITPNHQIIKSLVRLSQSHVGPLSLRRGGGLTS